MLRQLWRASSCVSEGFLGHALPLHASAWGGGRGQTWPSAWDDSLVLLGAAGKDVPHVSLCVVCRALHFKLKRTDLRYDLNGVGRAIRRTS